jgi:hypothetical protein
MNNSNAPNFSELLDWLEGKLPPEQAQAVAERLQTADAATQDDFDWLRLFLQARRSVQFATPPPRIRETLRARFASYAGARLPPGLFQRLLATLTFDSWAQAATTGLRSAQRADEGQQRQLVYTTEAAEIALSIQPALPNKNLTVTGQIFPAGDIPAHAFSVQLLRAGSEVDLTAVDDLGEFTFTDIPGGEYEMVVSAGEYEMVISPLLLQP